MQLIKIASAIAMAAALWLGNQAHAERMENPSTQKQWFTLDGKPLSAIDANHQKGKFLQCQVVEVVTNESTGRQTIKK